MHTLFYQKVAAPVCAALAAMALAFGQLGAAPALLASAGSAPALTQAAQITAGIEVVLPNDGPAAALLDSSRSSFVKLNGGQITIESETPFSALYLVWDTPPPAWTLAADGQADQQRANGFLHDAILLNAPTTGAALQLASEDYTLCDIYLFEAGALPAWVQQWQPTLEKADLLALPTHADDEHLFFGGILPTYAGQQGLRVQVVYMTNHWGERYRPHELLDGLWTVGVTAYPVMGPFPDLYESLESLESAERVFGREEVLAFQVEMLRCFKPAVVVGHDLAGEYGHGAHRLNAATLLDALPLCGDENSFPGSAAAHGVWEVPKVYLHLYPENELVMDWDVPLEKFGGATAFEMAQAGFAKHVSQQQYFSVRQDGTWQDCRKFGLAHTLVGPDIAKNDLFENIELAREDAPASSGFPASAPQSMSTVSSAPQSVLPQNRPQEGTGPGVLAPVVVAAAAVCAAVVLAAVLLVRKKRR